MKYIYFSLIFYCLEYCGDVQACANQYKKARVAHTDACMKEIIQASNKAPESFDATRLEDALPSVSKPLTILEMLQMEVLQEKKRVIKKFYTSCCLMYADTNENRFADKAPSYDLFEQHALAISRDQEDYVSNLCKLFLDLKRAK